MSKIRTSPGYSQIRPFTDEGRIYAAGEVVSLRRGATPVDFAFSIHTDAGPRCGGAKVTVERSHFATNSRMGIVEITNTHQQPSRDWLKFVDRPAKNSTAIRTKSASRAALMVARFERDLRKAGISLNKLINQAALIPISRLAVTIISMASWWVLRSGQDRRCYPRPDPKSEKPAAPAEVEPIRKSPVNHSGALGGVVVDGLGDILVRLVMSIRCRATPLSALSAVGAASRCIPTSVRVVWIWTQSDG